MKQSVLLFEFKFHQEIIPSQLEFLLAAKYDVHVFLDRSLWDDALFGAYKHRVRFNLYPNTRKWYQKIKLYFILRRYVVHNDISCLVVNTLDSRFGSFIIRGLRHLRKVGVAHRVQDISTDKIYQRNVASMDGVLTLSPHTFWYLRSQFPWAKRSSWFYPAFFSQKPHTHKEGSAARVVIPGQLSWSRRDYRSVIQVACDLKSQNKFVQFVLLGNSSANDGRSIVDSIKTAGVSNYFVHWNAFVSYKIFFEELNKADYIMPLLTPEIENAANYRNSQISAATNWAIAFRKRLILHSDFKDALGPLAENAVLYNTADLPALFLRLDKEHTTHFKDMDEFAFDRMKDNYLKPFID